MVGAWLDISEVDSALEDLDPALEELDSALEELDSALEELEPEFEEWDPALEELDSELPELDPELPELDPELEEMDPELSELDPELSDEPDPCSMLSESSEDPFEVALFVEFRIEVADAVVENMVDVIFSVVTNASCDTVVGAAGKAGDSMWQYIDTQMVV